MPRFAHRFLLVLLLVVIATPVRAADDPVRARLQATGTEAVTELTIAPGWHVNGTRPRDEFLIPTTLELKLPSGQTAGVVIWPNPVERTLAFALGKPFLLYEGTVKLTALLSGTPAAGSPPLGASLR